VLGISRLGLRAAILRAYWHSLFRLSTKVVHRGVTIGVLWPTAADQVAVDRVKDALDLLALFAPIQLKRLADLVHGISILPGGPAGSYVSAARVVGIRYSESFDTPVPTPAEFASVEIYRRNRDHGRPQFDLADARTLSRFHPVSTLDEVFEVALLPADKPMDTPKQIMEEREERAERQEKGKSGKRAVA
jgi:hypothetical protein